MTIPLVLDGAFPSEAALREMILTRQVCFDHDPFSVRDGTGNLVQIGFQLNLYAAFQDPRYMPVGDDEELHALLHDLRGLCRVFFQSLNVLKPCEHAQPPMHRVVYAPERRYRAEVCLQIPIFEQTGQGAKPDRHVEALLETAESLLRQLGAKRGAWDANAQVSGPATCDQQIQQASESDPAVS